jgi:four helix bundle protein
MSYRIEDLDVYRRCTAAAVKICRLADEAAAQGAPALGNELRRRGFNMAANLADGLGFWEREEKTRHFTAAKKAVLEALALLEVTAALGVADTGAQGDIAVDLRDLAKMTAGLLRGAHRRERQPGEEREKARAVQEQSRIYH